MVFITGSNAKMLSRDIQTTLGGRYLESMIYPYSFHEYLGAQNLSLTHGWQYSSIRSQVQRVFPQYMQWGGFPELLLYRNKRRWLNDLYEKILLGDVLLRNRIKNEKAIRLMMKRLAESLMPPTSYNRLANLVKGTGVSTTVSSVIDYVRYAEDACIIFSIDNFASKFVEKETVKKHYFMDNGLLSIFLTGTFAPLLENLCAIQLYRQYKTDLFFYNKNVEVDFFVPDEGYAVQVSYSITDEDTRKREVDALLKLNALHSLRRMVIVTFDEEETIDVGNNMAIEIIPAWKWLLESSDNAGHLISSSLP